MEEKQIIAPEKQTNQPLNNIVIKYIAELITLIFYLYLGDHAQTSYFWPS